MRGVALSFCPTRCNCLSGWLISIRTGQGGIIENKRLAIVDDIKIGYPRKIEEVLTTLVWDDNSILRTEDVKARGAK